MRIFINPGSGPVDNSTEQHAIENMRHFITDHQLSGLNFVRLPQSDYGEGRYAFLLYKGTRCHEIQMPGVPLNMVRFMDDKNQNIWDFPRLYVDGGSWVWQYAILDHKDDWNEPQESVY